MAKTSGVALTTLSIDDSGGTPRDLRNDFTSFDFATPMGVQDVTGLDVSAMERLILLADFSVTVNGVVNTASNEGHDVFKDISGGVARTVTIGHASVSLPNECLFTDYRITRPQSGELTYTSPGVLASGVVPTWA